MHWSLQGCCDSVHQDWHASSVVSSFIASKLVWFAQACHSLEQVLAEDQYLATRVERVTIDSHQKAAYSVYRSVLIHDGSDI